VVDALATTDGVAAGSSPADLAAVLKALAPRWFLLRDVYRRPSLVLAQSRTTLSWLRGPMTRGDIKQLGRQG
jgi:hypothetical protein